MHDPRVKRRTKTHLPVTREKALRRRIHVRHMRRRIHA
jgi:hypothetical protein